MVAFEDEVWLELNPIIGPGWMPRGKQRQVTTPGRNKRTNIFITMLWPSKKPIYTIRRRRRSKEFKEHLNSLLRYMRRHELDRLTLIMDNATIHRSRESKRFLDRHKDEVNPFYLPRYSPQLNEVEGRINKGLKRGISAQTTHTGASKR